MLSLLSSDNLFIRPLNDRRSSRTDSEDYKEGRFRIIISILIKQFDLVNGREVFPFSRRSIFLLGII